MPPKRTLAPTEPPGWPRIEATLSSSSSLFELEPPRSDSAAPLFRYAQPSMRNLFDGLVRDHASSDAECLVLHTAGRRAGQRWKFHEFIAGVASSLRSLALPKYGQGARIALDGSQKGAEWLFVFWSGVILGCEVGLVASGTRDEQDDSARETAADIFRGARARFVPAEEAARLGVLGSIPLPPQQENGNGLETERISTAPSSLIVSVATVLLPPPGSTTFSNYPSSYHLSSTPSPSAPKPTITPWPEYRHEAGNPFWTDLTYPSSLIMLPGGTLASIHAARIPSDRGSLSIPAEMTQTAWTQLAHALLHVDMARRVRRMEFQCAPVLSNNITAIYGKKREKVLVVGDLEPVEFARVGIEAGMLGWALHFVLGKPDAVEIERVVEREGITRIML